MKGDITRNSFRPDRRFTGVRLQQGRTQIDADWNEQVDIAAERVRAGTRDLIGPAGGPLPSPGFEIVADPETLATPLSEDVVEELTEHGHLPLAAGDVLILPGRYYVHGWLVENPVATTLIAQPHGGGAALAEGVHLLYLDVWERHITFVEDELIREVALGGADTATRAQLVWQVRSLPVDEGFHCLSDDADWDALVAGSTGRMAARAEPPDEKEIDPCVVPASAGYRGLQNRLYRVEIHRAGSLANATFKWSRDNGTVLYPIDEVGVGGSEKLVRVRHLGRDESLGLKIGDWVEVLDDAVELAGTPGLLTKVADIDADDLLVALEDAVVDLSPARHAKLRRWDSAGAIDLDEANWIALEDGIEVQFGVGTYRTGDHWSIPARTVLGNPLLVDANGLEWPLVDDHPEARSPEGIRHRYARIAVVSRTWDATAREHDCRAPFPALTELKQLHYSSGDGQEAMPDLTVPEARVPLAKPLRAGVSNGIWPVAGARVHFRLLDDTANGLLYEEGSAAVEPGLRELILLTGADGTVGCEWHLDGDPEQPVQQVEATLLDAAASVVHLPIVFTANLSMASRVAYDPRGCSALATAREVQQAIELLASLAQLHYAGGDGQETAPGSPMPLPLKVRVASACGPVVGAGVLFQASHGGTLSSDASPGPAHSLVVPTNEIGIAEVRWQPDAGVLSTQSVHAELQGGGMRIGAFTTIDFNGRVVQASVAEEPGIRVKQIRIGNALLELDSVVQPQNLMEGIRIDLADPFDQTSIGSKGKQHPVISVALGLPYPLTKQDQWFWPGDDINQPVYGFMMLEIRAAVGIDGNSITWMPAPETHEWLSSLLFAALEREKREIKEILVRLTLRGSFVLSADPGREIHLDGDAFRTRKSPGYALPSGDGRKGGTLELWFWIAEKA